MGNFKITQKATFFQIYITTKCIQKHYRKVLSFLKLHPQDVNLEANKKYQTAFFIVFVSPIYKIIIIKSFI